jgi:methionine aminopeptidase type I
MELKPEQITKIIREQIKNYETKLQTSETGIVILVGDGIAKVSGLDDCMSGELVEFPNGSYGMAQNLEEDTVSIVILGTDSGIREGDVVSIDVGVRIDGAVGDTARTVAVGEVSADVKRLLSGTIEALDAGIAACRIGNRVGHISSAVEKCAHRHRLGVVRDYVGHGCGIKLHEPPEVPNFSGWGSGVKLEPGMVLAIEPMLNLGTWKVVTDRSDHWTVRTTDGLYSAHFEHMVLITENQPEILTWPKMM